MPPSNGIVPKTDNDITEHTIRTSCLVAFADFRFEVKDVSNKKNYGEMLTITTATVLS